MVKWIAISILFLPVAEIATFILLAALIGLGWTLALMLVTTVAGFLVLRQAGRGRIARFRVAAAERSTTGFEADISGFLTVLAGLLLFLPGFLTDLAGVLLLLRPVRRRCAAALDRAVTMGAHGGARSAVLDLAPDEWHRTPDCNASRDQNRIGPD